MLVDNADAPTTTRPLAANTAVGDLPGAFVRPRASVQAAACRCAGGLMRLGGSGDA